VIEKVATKVILPHWLDHPTNRYRSHPSLRVAFIQRLDEPETIFVVSEQALPQSTAEAMEMIDKWREANETAED